MRLKVVIRNFCEEDIPTVFLFYKTKNILSSDSYKYQPHSKGDFHRLVVEEGPYGERFDPAGFFLAFEDDKLLGAASANAGYQDSQNAGKKIGFIAPGWPWSPLGFTIRSGYRRKGIDTILLEKCLEYLREKGAKWAQTSIGEKYLENADFFSRHGFEQWGKNVVYMERDLREPITEPALPEGYSFREFRLGEENELIECDNGIFRDEWLYLPRSVANFVNYYERNPDFDFDISGFLNIIFENKIIGFSWNVIPKGYIKYSGRKVGFLEGLGVYKEHRQKGIGTALLLRSLNWHRQKRMNYASVVTHSETAMRLYRKCGFKISSRWKILRKLF